MTSDAGAGWSRVYDAIGDLPGFSISPDGATVALSGPEDGLFTASSAALVGSGGSAFTKTFEGRVWGLHWTSAGLFAGNDDFGPADGAQFTVGVSTDSGKSFQPLGEICEFELAACDPGTRSGGVCPTQFSSPRGFEEDFLESERCVPASGSGGASSDAGPASDGKRGVDDSDDDGCAIGSRGVDSRAAVWLTLAATLAAAARRRRQRPGASS
jgi:hypothetical protein